MEKIRAHSEGTMHAAPDDIDALVTKGIDNADAREKGIDNADAREAVTVRLELQTHCAGR